MAFGVDANAIRDRKLYLPWEVGKPPDFVLEVASESTARQDIIGKRLIYAQIGVLEYWRLDPTGGDHYGQPLEGECLIEGVYRPIDLTIEPDGVLKGYSPSLALYLSWRDEGFSLYDPEAGQYLRNLVQIQDALRAERAAREAGQARIQQLEEELRRRQSEN